MVYYDWNAWAFWGFFLFMIIFGSSLWWPARWSTRGRRFDDTDPRAAWGPPYGFSLGKHSGKAPRGYRRSDSRIGEEINDRLMIAGELDPSEVEVLVRDGEVTLNGSVKTRYEKRLAEALADLVPGVKDVRNELTIGNSKKQDRIAAA